MSEARLLPLPRVFADESGQTGEDLLLLEQPVFSVGSVLLGDEEAERILKDAGLNERRVGSSEDYGGPALEDERFSRHSRS
jgi:hypothetical protein